MSVERYLEFSEMGLSVCMSFAIFAANIMVIHNIKLRDEHKW